MSAQKLGKLLLFIAVLPQECMGQLVSCGPISCLAHSQLPSTAAEEDEFRRQAAELEAALQRIVTYGGLYIFSTTTQPPYSHTKDSITVTDTASSI